MVVLTSYRDKADRLVPDMRFSSDGGVKTSLDVLSSATRCFEAGQEVRMPTSRQLFKQKQTVINGVIVTDNNPITFGCYGETRDSEGRIVYTQKLGRHNNKGRIKSKTLSDVTVDNVPLLLKKILQHRGYTTMYSVNKAVGKLQTNTEVYFKEGRHCIKVNIDYIKVKRFTVTEYTQLLPTYFSSKTNNITTITDGTMVKQTIHNNDAYRHRHIKHHVQIDYMFDKQFIKEVETKIHNARMANIKPIAFK